MEREGGTIVRRVPIRRFGPTNLNYLSHDVSPCLPVSLSFRAAGNFLGLRTVIVYTLLLHHSIVTFPPLLVRTRSPAIRFRAPLSVHFARPIRPAPHPPVTLRLCYSHDISVVKIRIAFSQGGFARGTPGFFVHAAWLRPLETLADEYPLEVSYRGIVHRRCGCIGHAV